MIIFCCLYVYANIEIVCPRIEFGERIQNRMYHPVLSKAWNAGLVLLVLLLGAFWLL